MKITKVETIWVDEFWQMCWVRVHTDSGEIGLGETCIYHARSRLSFMRYSARP